MCKLKIRRVKSHPYSVLYVIYLALHCPTMRNYYCKKFTGARKIHGTGSQLSVLTVKSTGSFYCVFLTLSSLKTKQIFANSVDPDETALNEPSNQDIHCLLYCFVADFLLCNNGYAQVQKWKSPL